MPILASYFLKKRKIKKKDFTKPTIIDIIY